MTEDKPKIPHARLPRPDGEGWELDPYGDWWRWEPPPEGGWPKGEPLVFTREDLIARLRPNGEPPALAPRSSKISKADIHRFRFPPSGRRRKKLSPG